jgi:hypothetical protein
VEVGTALCAEGAETFSSTEGYDRLVEDGHEVPRRTFRAAMSHLTGRVDHTAARFVAVTPGRYRFRTGEAVGFAPLEAPAPVSESAVHAEAARPDGCRAAVLEVGAELAGRDPEGLFTMRDLAEALAAPGHTFARSTLQFMLFRMCDGKAGPRPLLDELGAGDGRALPVPSEGPASA